jgi:hypothetical protein
MIGGYMDEHTLDPERRKRQQDAFRKIVEAGSVPPVMPQPPSVLPTKPYELNHNDRVFLRSLRISPE